MVRHVTRYGRAETAFSMSDRRIGVPSDLQRGTRRALRLRRAEAAQADSTLTWLPAPRDVLSPRRGGALRVGVDLSAHPVEPPHTANC